MDKKIEEFALGIKNNVEYTKILNDTISRQKGKTLNKIKLLFKLNK